LEAEGAAGTKWQGVKSRRQLVVVSEVVEAVQSVDVEVLYPGEAASTPSWVRA
jgi:hypothetical protein